MRLNLNSTVHHVLIGGKKLITSKTNKKEQKIGKIKKESKENRIKN